MISLKSKESHQIKFPVGPHGVVSVFAPLLSVTIETGVAVFNFLGTNPNDWTRDSLSFPVGAPCTAAEFVSGIASASPASFWTPMFNATVNGGLQVSSPVTVNGYTDDNHSVSASGTVTIGVFVPPPVGFAVDSAAIAYSAQAGQPVIQLGLAAFGDCSDFQRVSYTAYIINSHGGLGGGTTTTNG